VSQPFEIESTPSPPPLWGRTVLCPTADEAIGALTTDLLQQALACVAQFGDLHLALSGDPMMEPIYRRLMYDPPLRNFPWSKTHLWLIDEHEARPSRFSRVHELLAVQSGIPASQVHRIPIEHADAADRYQQEFQGVLEWREKGHDRLDAAILALSADAPPLALWGTPRDAQPLIAQDAGMVAMTPRLLSAARLIAIYAAGTACRPRLSTLRNTTPWRSLDPVGGSLHWYLDHDACAHTTP